jgi:hypothetical protein
VQLAFALLGGALVGCGPSVQAVYESNVRFEHCYRLDLDRDTAPSHRQTCWNEWVRTYNVGQTRDRIEYAKRRLRYLASGETSPPPLNLDAASQPEAAPEAPAPTNLHTPPPALLKAPEPPAPSASASAPPGPQLPKDQCAGECAESYRACVSPCNGADADVPSRCVGCERDYARCMQRCFK